MVFDKDTNQCDLYINDNGMVEIIDENLSIAQSLKDELESNMKTWYLGYYWGAKLLQDDGSGLFDSKNTSDEEILQEIYRIANKNPEIHQVDVLSITRSGRRVDVEIEIKTKYGDSTLKVLIQ